MLKELFSFIIEELHEQNSAFSSKEALISRLNERRQKTLIGLVEYIKNGKMHSAEKQSSGRSDTNLEASPEKSALLSAAKRLLIRLHDENGDKCLFYPIPNRKVYLTLSRSTQIKAEQQRCSRNKITKEHKQVGQSTGA